MPDVLILEDQPGWGAFLTSAMRNNQLPASTLHRVETYGEAIALVKEISFHVALLDYSLSRVGPEGRKTGLDVARELRKATPAAAIFLITLVDPERVESDCAELGVRLIEKGRPDLEAEIVREVRRALISAVGLPDKK